MIEEKTKTIAVVALITAVVWMGFIIRKQARIINNVTVFLSVSFPDQLNAFPAKMAEFKKTSSAPVTTPVPASVAPAVVK